MFKRVSDGKILSVFDHDNSNVARRGLAIAGSLHFANFAGIDLRILYFVIGLAVSGMIIAGNLLWVNKRVKQNSQSKRFFPLSITRKLA